MNKPLRRIAIFCGILVLALLVRTNYIQYVRADELNANEHNRRVQIERYAHERGNIIVDGEPVTGSVETTDSDFKYKRVWKDGPMWAPVTGYSSQAFDSSQLESIEDGILTGNSDDLFFDRTLSMFTGDKKTGGNIVTTSTALPRRQPSRDWATRRAPSPRSTRRPAPSWPWPARPRTTPRSSPATP